MKCNCGFHFTISIPMEVVWHGSAKGRGEQVVVTLPEMETLYESPADIRRALNL